MRRVLLLTLTLILVAASAPARGAADGEGAVHRFAVGKFRALGTIAAPSPADAFGTRVADRFIATAPAAPGGGAIYFVSEGEIDSGTTAAELSGAETARLGEAWADLGHPPGVSSALAIGAPASTRAQDAAPGTALPAVVLVEYNGRRFVDEVSRVTGPRGSGFGWRVRSTDSRFPEASFNGAFVVAAPLQNRGKKRQEAGAVSKYDTETGRRLWRFRSRRGGEMAGYALRMVPDQDDDGFADVLVGAPGTSDRTVPGRVYLLSGRNGKVIGQLEAPEEAVLFGYEVGWGSALAPFPGFLISAPRTARGAKDDVGAVYVHETLDSEPTVLRGRRPGQWFGVSMGADFEFLYVGSFEGSKKAARHRRGSVTVFRSTGKKARTLWGDGPGAYFGRALSAGAALAVGAPGVPPFIEPR